MNEIFAAAGILWRKNTYLAVRRPEGKIMAGYWEFPGGKLELGESAEQALFRELQEELGIVCSEAIFWQRVHHEYTHGTIHLDIFHVTAFAGNPAPLENQEMRWIMPSEGTALRFLPADISLVAELLVRYPDGFCANEYPDIHCSPERLE